MTPPARAASSRGITNRIDGSLGDNARDTRIEGGSKHAVRLEEPSRPHRRRLALDRALREAAAPALRNALARYRNKSCRQPAHVDGRRCRQPITSSAVTQVSFQVRSHTHRSSCPRDVACSTRTRLHEGVVLLRQDEPERNEIAVGRKRGHEIGAHSSIASTAGQRRGADGPRRPCERSSGNQFVNVGSRSCACTPLFRARRLHRPTRIEAQTPGRTLEARGYMAATPNCSRNVRERLVREVSRSASPDRVPGSMNTSIARAVSP